MGRKNRHTKLSHAAHIKRHTEGTSNELSFSVLDAAKNAADAEGGRDGKAKVPRFGGISLFTLPGKKKTHSTPQKDEMIALSSRGPVGMGSQPTTVFSGPTDAPKAAPSAPYEPPVDEIARRKTRRRIRNALAIAAMIVTVIGLAGAGASFLYKEHTAHTERMSHLERALSDLTSADEIILEMDELINGKVDDGTEEKVTTVKQKLPDATALLDSAEQAVQAADSEANPSQEKEAVVRARAAIAARREMIEQGPLIMDAAVAAHRASEIVEAAWAEVVGADSLAREAAELIADTTMENVQASKEKTEEANELFNDALAQLRAGESAYQGTDLSDQIEYVETRIAAMGYAIASDDAILAFNKEEAAAQNDAYNEADREAAELAKGLSDRPSELIHSTYLRDIEQPSKLYGEARSKAETADAFIRDYLGSNGK